MKSCMLVLQSSWRSARYPVKGEGELYSRSIHGTLYHSSQEPQHGSPIFDFCKWNSLAQPKLAACCSLLYTCIWYIKSSNEIDYLLAEPEYSSVVDSCFL